MAAQVLSFFQRSPRYAPKPADWSQQELAEFYRVESALIRAGIRVGTDRGLSDENEPWFVFFRADDGEVVIHFARIDGEYLIAGPAYEEIARGFDFSSLVRNLVARHPLIRRSNGSSNISVHPAALLVAIVGTAFFKTGEARAAETGATNAHSGHARPTLLSSSSPAAHSGVAPMAMPASHDTAQIPANQAVLIMAAAMFASDFGVDATSLDPAVRTAISAAAAALDFGGGAPAAPTAGDLTLAAPSTHAQTVDNTPAQAVSSVLSLVAILSTMPAQVDAPQGGEALPGVAAHLGRPDLMVSTLAAPSAASSWTIDVRLGLNLGGLPSVAAVQLVRGLAGEAGAQKISVIEVAKLPDVLADLIARGDHYGVGVSHPPPAQVETPPVTVDPTPTTPSDGGGDAPPPTGGDPAPPSTPIPAEPEPPKPTPVEPSPIFASPDLVKQFIDYFLAHTPSIEVMVNGLNIVMFDSRVLHDVGAISNLDSMTFHFDDGGSISLVGDHSSFLQGWNLV